jgi:hypothetical protein
MDHIFVCVGVMYSGVNMMFVMLSRFSTSSVRTESIKNVFKFQNFMNVDWLVLP